MNWWQISLKLYIESPSCTYVQSLSINLKIYGPHNWFSWTVDRGFASPLHAEGCVRPICISLKQVHVVSILTVSRPNAWQQV